MTDVTQNGVLDIKYQSFVIPAKAGIHIFELFSKVDASPKGIPFGTFAGMTLPLLEFCVTSVNDVQPTAFSWLQDSGFPGVQYVGCRRAKSLWSPRRKEHQ